MALEDKELELNEELLEFPNATFFHSKPAMKHIFNEGFRDSTKF